VTERAQLDLPLIGGSLGNAEAGGYLLSVFEHTPIAIAIVRGESHTFDFANPAFQQFAECRPLLGRGFGEAMPVQVARSVVPALDEVQRTGLRITGTLRAAREYELSYQPVPGVGDEVAAIVVVANDVTALSEARRAAEAASRAKDEFFARLGHELRNPLAPILTALHVMRMRGVPGVAREQAILERQVQHLVRLVDDLLDVSRFSRGQLDLKRARVELADVVRTAIEMASPLIEQRQHVLEVDVPTTGLVVFGDHDRLAQVVCNLLTNAAKYSASSAPIRVRATSDEGHVVLRVRDEGVGIPPDMLPNVFDLFVQERQGIDRAKGGLGLGLSIVKMVVALHDGTVDATSNGPGQGSEFVVRLPLAGETPSPTLSSPSLEIGAHSQRVLIVDDNEDACEMLAEALKRQGYEVRTAADGPSALRVAETFVPEIALLDIGLPVMDGYELAERLRRYPAKRRPTLVAVTGYGQESDERKAREAGFAAHIVKPVDLRLLGNTLRRLEASARDASA
jgi:signal transduction histidine kinase/ActR/RegA family two-component response regulator